jgi:hypothetical protein
MHQSHSGSKPANGETDPRAKARYDASVAEAARTSLRLPIVAERLVASLCANRARRPRSTPRGVDVGCRTARAETRRSPPPRWLGWRATSAAQWKAPVTTFALVGRAREPRSLPGGAVRAARSHGGTGGSDTYKIAQATQGSSSSRGVMALCLRCLPPPTRLRTRGWHSSPAAARDARGRPHALGVFCPKELTARRRAS